MNNVQFELILNLKAVAVFWLEEKRSKSLLACSKYEENCGRLSAQVTHELVSPRTAPVVRCRIEVNGSNPLLFFSRPYPS
jgi:hypothetical protein